MGFKPCAVSGAPDRASEPEPLPIGCTRPVNPTFRGAVEGASIGPGGTHHGQRSTRTPPERLGRDFWKKTIADQRRSGLSQADFCHQEGLSLSTLQRWRSRLTKAEGDSLSSTPPGFVAVEVFDRGDTLDGEALELLFPSGLMIRVPPHFKAESLLRFLWAVEVAGQC